MKTKPFITSRILTTLIFVVALIQWGNADAQNFNSYQKNPFSLTDMGHNSAPAFADLDGDGDLDMMSGDIYGEFYYFKNIGSSSSPYRYLYPKPPLSSSDLGHNSAPAFADLDGDGDLDMMSGDIYGEFYYFKNIGSSSSPYRYLYPKPPLSSSDLGHNSAPAFADLDGDGDLDMMSGDIYGEFYYFKNSASSGIFEISKYHLPVIIWPNPTNGVMQLEISNYMYKSNSYDLRICNVIGETVFHLSNVNLQFTIDISEKPIGIYFVKISDDKEVYTGKIIKQ